ncbi:MAG: hypothetical protein KGL63_00190 [Betaproteobacteria bacterium]|nr:hypothetical protein [Betaproteobacteria bacterium]
MPPIDPAIWLDHLVDYLSRLEWPTLEDFHNWYLLYPDFALLGEIALGLLVLVFGLGWLVGRLPAGQNTVLSPAEDEPAAMPEGLDFERRLGISRADLAEVGLPLVTPETEPVLFTPVGPMMSLMELSSEHLIVIARYCLWRGDSEGARDAIAPILIRDDVPMRRAALSLLEIQ